MFKIYGDHTKFNQWMMNQKLIVDDEIPVGADIHFYNNPGEDDPLMTAVYEMNDNGKKVLVCDVPNILLTTTSKIKVCVPSKVRSLYGKVHSILGQREKYFEVVAAEKPSDYVYEETELESGSSLIVSDDKIEDAVKKYLDENGTPSGGISEDDIATNDEVAGILDDIFGA